MEQKDIDRLFQEKLKDIEVTPNPRVWNAIEQKLQKKKRRIIPVWWFFSGAAAAFVLGLFLFFNKNEKQQKNDFPIITKEVINDYKEKGKEVKFNNKEVNQIPVIAEEVIEVKERKAHKKKEFIKYKRLVVTEKVIEKSNFEEKIKTLIVVENSGEKKSFKEGAKLKKEENIGLQLIVERNFKEKEKNKSLKAILIADNASKEENIVKGITSFNETPPKKSVSFPKEVLLDSVNTTIAEKGVQEVSEEVIKKDFSSSDIIVNKKNSVAKKKDFIVEVAKEKEFLKTKEVKNNKWAVSPTVGVLKSNSFTQASALDTDLNTNDFSGENSVAYGIHVTYNLNKKWALKSGIQIQKTAFTTNNVALFSSSSFNANSLENVFLDSNNGSTDNVPELNPDNGFIPDVLQDGQGEEVFLDVSESGSLLQSYGYIEIPLEIKYTFFSSKIIQTSVVTGFSSLILNENSIVSTRNSVSNDIGEATNLNTINFSGNFGFDIDIRLSEKINLSVNPIFKTQLNTFSENSNGFQPYNIGVYTGLKYHF